MVLLKIGTLLVRVVSVEIIEGDFVVGEPVFGEESAAFGQIHAFDRADANFVVSPISTSAAGWERQLDS